MWWVRLLFPTNQIQTRLNICYGRSQDGFNVAYAGTMFAVNIEHADSHRHVETNGRRAVTAESDQDEYSALMLTID